MKRKKQEMKIIWRAVVTGMLLLPVYDVYGGLSEAGAVFLTFFPDARQNGMGGVFTAIADDALATYYNDAGIGFQQKRDIGFTHMNLLPGLYPGKYYENLSAVIPIFKPDSGEYRQAIGVNAIWLHTGKTEGIDDMGREISEWTTWDLAVKVSYANRLTDKLSVGAGVKYIYDFLCPLMILHIDSREYRYGGSGKSFAFDVSGLYVFNKQWQAGMSLQNLGPDITYIESGTGDHLPWTLRLGVSYKPNKNLTIAGDLTKCLVGIQDDIKEIQEDAKEGYTYLYRDIWKGIGLEYKFYKIFSVRWGYFVDDIGKRKGPTLGLGMKVSGWSVDIANDSHLYEFPTDNLTLSVHYSF